jgi:hypothetical protein
VTISRTTIALAALLGAPLVPLAACSSPSDTTHVVSDAGTDGGGGGGGGDVKDAGTDAATRTLVQRALFGDVHPQNLFIDPNFSVRQAGLGDWSPLSSDPSSPTASLSASLMSDSPAGIALPVGRLADGKGSTKNFGLDLLTQVPGGPGPYHLRVWISTLDPAASATIKGVTVGLLTSLGADLIAVTEDESKAQVFVSPDADGGSARTWHLFEGQLAQAIDIGAFVVLDFPASKNTWLLQAPELIPVAIDPAPQAEIIHRRAADARPATPALRSLIERHRREPRISVPASHPAVSERPKSLLQR